MSQSGEPKEDGSIEYILDEYENGQNPHQSEEYRINKAVKAIEAHTQRKVIEELEKVKLIYRNFDIDWQYLDMLIEEIRDK